MENGLYGLWSRIYEYASPPEYMNMPPPVIKIPIGTVKWNFFMNKKIFVSRMLLWIMFIIEYYSWTNICSENNLCI